MMFGNEKKKRKVRVTLSLKRDVLKDLDKERKRIGADNRSDLAESILGGVLRDEETKKDVLF